MYLEVKIIRGWNIGSKVCVRYLEVKNTTNKLRLRWLEVNKQHVSLMYLKVKMKQVSFVWDIKNLYGM